MSQIDRLWRLLRVGLAIGLAGPALAQGILKPGTRVPASVPANVPIALEGSVWLPGGAPAEGAVVVSSAGGRAVVDVVGRYRLETRVPPKAERVQVTAVGAASTNLTASTSVELVTTDGVVEVDPLHLTPVVGCQPEWLPTFGGRPGMDGEVLAMTVFDDGGGPALYAGGDFRTAGGVQVNHIAKWNGSSWEALGSGLSLRVYSLTVYDDGDGPALYAGGFFGTAGGVSANHIAKWNGSTWSALGGGLNNLVYALTVYDDGSGPALYAGGVFTTSGGGPANGIARWNGASWSALGSGAFAVHALTVYDDGGGPALYAGGTFTTAGGGPANRIAKWNGSSWSALGSGVNGNVAALAVYDDGTGRALHAGGVFTTAGGVPASCIAKWNGSSWAALGSGMTPSSLSQVWSLTVYDDGGGPALHAGGIFTTAGGVSASSIARWNGSSWAALGSGMTPGSSSPVFSLTVYDDGGGPALYAGGRFSVAGGVPADRIAKWHGSKWSALGKGLNAAVVALTVYDDGSGPALYAGGGFVTADGLPASGIAKWDGASWSALGSGVSGTVFDLAVYDDGDGPALYAGGSFTTAGGVPASRIAKWNGSSWAALASGVNGSVAALTVYDDGNGPALYAGGGFTTAGGVPASSVAKWNGASWAALASGVNGGVTALTVYDDGGGPALYAGGTFTTAGGVQVNHIARWNGASWAALDSGTDGQVAALTVYDDGSGQALYAGGYFFHAGVVTALRIAKWDGSSWAALGSVSGVNSSVIALTVHDDGSGPALYAGGTFTTTGGIAANGIAKWNGASWAALGSGLNTSVQALAAHDDGSGPALYAGGAFSASPAGDSFLARWGCLAPACTTYRLDFETEDDFVTPLANGQAIDSEFGALVVISATGANDGAAIFDTTPGGPNDPALNDDMLIGHGNVLLLEDDWYGWAQSVPGFFDVVTDDPHGGELVFDFTAPVDPRSLLLADINPPPNQGASVTLVDEAGRTRVYAVEPGWTGTYGNAGPHTLDLTTLAPQAGNGTPRLATATESQGFLQGRVVEIVVRLTGFGAVDELEFCR